MFILSNLDVIVAELMLFGIVWVVGKEMFEYFQDFRVRMKRK